MKSFTNNITAKILDSVAKKHGCRIRIKAGRLRFQGAPEKRERVLSACADLIEKITGG